MDVLLVNLTTAMASVAIPTGEEYAALPNPQKAAVAAAVKREVDARGGFKPVTRCSNQLSIS